MSETLKLTLLSPERRLLEALEVDSVTLPGSEGQIQILPGHAAMIGTLSTGELSYQPKGQSEELGVVSTGFFEVSGSEVSVMAETLERRGEIDVARAKTAQAKAEQALLAADLDEHKFRKYELKLQRAIVRQQVAAKGVHA